MVNVVDVWHTGFQVADLKRSMYFYCDLLGFEVVWERTVEDDYIGELVGYPGLVLRQALLRIPGTGHCLELLDYRNVERTPVDTRTANPGTAHICLWVDDLAGLHERLTAAGVEFVSKPLFPTIGPNTGRLVAYMCDPDGIRIELVERDQIRLPMSSPAAKS